MIVTKNKIQEGLNIQLIMNKDTKILIISPHPDDEAICSGGLIMKARKLGAKVMVLYMSTGTSRQFQNGVTLERDRIKEAKKAAHYGNFLYEMGFDNSSTMLDTLAQKVLIEFIEDRIKMYPPDIVVIPSRTSYAQDHRAIAMACISALRPIPEKLHPQPKMILEMIETTTWPNSSTPNFYVDISDVIDEKIKLYKCHKSQVTKDPHIRSCENLRRIAGTRGAEIGVKYAEGYNLLKGQL